MTQVEGRNVIAIPPDWTRERLAAALGWRRTATRRKRRVDGTLGQPFTVEWLDLGRVDRLLARPDRINAATVHRLVELGVIEMPTTKLCRRCGRDRPLDEFAKAKAGQWGRGNRCRRCRAEQAQEVRAARPDHYRAENVRFQRIRRLKLTRSGEVYAVIVLGDPCAYCGGPSDVIDHIDPLSGGGVGDATNLTGACRSCNSAKNAKPLLVFLATRR